MVVIYHSRGALAARLAAAMHLGWLRGQPPGSRAGAEEAWRRVQVENALHFEGLWLLGEDESGRRVFALGRASRADVTYRAFHGMADIYGLDKRSFLLQRAGGPVAWDDHTVWLLRSLRLGAIAHRVETGAVRRVWGSARDAAERARERLAISEHRV